MTFNLPSPPGFQGLREDLPVTCYTRHLPHWRQDGATYFVTFRLADSLPQSKLRELSELKRRWEVELGIANTDGSPTTPGPQREQPVEQLSRRVMERVERWLDAGMGQCLLRQRAVAREVTEAFHFFDGKRYELGAYVVMPNHVHLILRPFRPDVASLEVILKSRTGFTAQRINRACERQGVVWQEESFDRIIRDEEHLWRCIQYVGRNPSLARLRVDACLRWIRPEWEALGWRFEGE
jgi:putative transposase